MSGYRGAQTNDTHITIFRHRMNNTQLAEENCKWTKLSVRNYFGPGYAFSMHRWKRSKNSIDSRAAETDRLTHTPKWTEFC